MTRTDHDKASRRKIMVVQQALGRCGSATHKILWKQPEATLATGADSDGTWYVSAVYLHPDTGQPRREKTYLQISSKSDGTTEAIVHPNNEPSGFETWVDTGNWAEIDKAIERWSELAGPNSESSSE